MGNDFLFLFHNLRSCNFYSFLLVPESSFLWLDAALWWSSQQLLSYSTVFIFCVRHVFVFFQKKEASKFGQELTAEFKLSSIKLYLTQHSEMAIIFYWTHCPWVSLSWKHQKTYLCASSFHFWQISHFMTYTGILVMALCPRGEHRDQTRGLLWSVGIGALSVPEQAGGAAAWAQSLACKEVVKSWKSWTTWRSSQFFCPGLDLVMCTGTDLSLGHSQPLGSHEALAFWPCVPDVLQTAKYTLFFSLGKRKVCEVCRFFEFSRQFFHLLFLPFLQGSEQLFLD